MDGIQSFRLASEIQKCLLFKMIYLDIWKEVALIASASVSSERKTAQIQELESSCVQSVNAGSM